MEINIQITGATPVELQRLIMGMQLSDTVLGKVPRKGIEVNFKNAIWSPEEKIAIRDCTDEKEAWEQYRERFPKSARTSAAVRRMFSNVRENAAPVSKPADGLPAEIPPIKKEATVMAEKKPEPKKKESPLKKLNKWALKGDKVPCPHCKKMCDPRGLHKHVKTCPSRISHEAKPSSKAIASSNGVKVAEPLLHSPGHGPADPHKVTTVVKPIEIEGADKITLPTDRPLCRGDLKKGTRVKQIGGVKIMSGIGVIERSPSNQPEVLVRFDNGLEWMPRNNLQVVAEGVGS